MVYDTQTGLEWYIGADENMNYDTAIEFLGDLKISGGGWRLPTIEELQRIYEMRGVFDVGIDPIFKTGNGIRICVWSGEKENKFYTGAHIFDFQLGKAYWRSSNELCWVLGVRSGKR